ncbi:aminomethyl-transferring glycine dehydrogenase [Haliangium ochraceum]|uniref:Glycine dehydrogenase (decarboxylating) n=1 Tax=Haliangium ochraceum (strain DSM 14365 / JCM 11303 / SMP-2) TaxID=502025 RepID=D0LZG0_HALO1|nr:glycine dehydrogenase [Haliangium ochraceum DSM 14365]
MRAMVPPPMKRDVLSPSDTFAPRHIGPRDEDIAAMLATLGLDSLDALIAQAIPDSIRSSFGLTIGDGLGESAALAKLRAIADKNRVFRSFIGMGYSECITPPVIQRNVLENPGWYTQYTPYQAEISQGRLEVLLTFQTMVADLTGLPLANASLLDEATAAAEAMAMCQAITRGKKPGFFAASHCHPQTLTVLRTRAESQGVALSVGALDGPELTSGLASGELAGVLVQYPTTTGAIEDFEALAARVHEAGALLVVAADLLALTLLRPPGEFGADIALGSTQRFGVPMGFGGPHAAYLATHESNKRVLPGRLIGASRDAEGKLAYRLALQTREQHIRRDRATSNICTAQVLLALMAALYGVYHGPQGLRRIAQRVRAWTLSLRRGLEALGHAVDGGPVFDTLRVVPQGIAASDVIGRAEARCMNLRRYDDGALGISLSETTTADDIGDLLACFAVDADPVAASDNARIDALIAALDDDALAYPGPLARASEFLTHERFHRYHAEHELLRYLNRLQARDLSLTTSMIPLGSCTMKLNATSEMLPVTWASFGGLHPFAPAGQSEGYAILVRELCDWLAQLTGFAAVSLQPNSGAQGEYAGLLAIRGYHQAHAEDGAAMRDVCLIPTSAHGTNPASAVMAGMRVVAVQCDKNGNIDVDDLAAKAEKHADALAALMITYPSTHGVFEHRVREICDIVHARGGQVYLDGANMNAQVGVCRPGDYGADVCHLNLHKTFCIPHGGGGPGMGPIAVATHLAPYLPGDPLGEGEQAVGPVSAAPYGSASILPISWMFIAMMGAPGLRKATEVAVLNANYMATRLREHYEVLYAGAHGRVAHEFILDCRPFKKSAGIEVEDIAKRLMDYGFHAPTMSWPVPGTLMIEPTESEARAELDRFCEAMIQIRGEIAAIEAGRADREDNPLKRAPHTAQQVSADNWERGYSREQAAYPVASLREYKYWPPVARVDNAYGDRNLVCTCPSLEELSEPE